MKNRIRFKNIVGVNYEEWNKVKFWDAVEMNSTLVDPTDEKYSNMVHVGPANIEKFTGILLECKTAKEEGLTSGKFIFDEDCIVYSKIRPELSKATIPGFKGLCSADAYPLKPKSNIRPQIILIQLLGDRFYKYVTTISSRTKMPKVNKNELAGFEFFIPSLEEQDRIIGLFNLLDRKIEMQRQIVDKLNVLKKSVFERNIDCDFPMIKLKDILSERKEYSEKGKEFPHVTLSKDGIYEKNERYNRDFLVKDENKQYKITKKNDLCYNPANLKFGVICLNDFGNAIFSPIYVTFEISNIAIPKYIQLYTSRNNFINEVRKFEQGTVYERMSVSPEDFLKFSIKLPSLEKQREIIKSVEIIEHKLFNELKKLEKLQELKKGLMQNMFV